MILAQGAAQVLSGGPQHIPDNNILPFFLGSPPPANTDFNSVAATFTGLNLSTPTTFRFASPGVTQEMVENPNSVLQAALQASLAATTMRSRTFLHVSTTHNPLHAAGATGLQRDPLAARHGRHAAQAVNEPAAAAAHPGSG